MISSSVRISAALYAAVDSEAMPLFSRCLGLSLSRGNAGPVAHHSSSSIHPADHVYIGVNISLSLILVRWN